MLRPRTEIILKVLVEEYIDTATPVPSESIARKSGLRVSPATIRNEMVELEEAGYIVRPHVSAGGVPSDRGYRAYVESLDEALEPPPEMQELTRREFARVGRDLEAWIQLAARLLAQAVGSVAIVTFPSAPTPRLKHVELVQLQEFLALLIVVLQEARLRQQLMPLSEPLSQDDLLRVANKLNAIYGGLAYEDMDAKQVELTPFEAQVKEQALAILKEAQEQATSYYTDGLRLLLRQPEFARGTQASELVEMLEEKLLVKGIVAEPPEEGKVKVVIGEENVWKALWPFSLVMSRYGLPGEATGVMTVLGPTRMGYPESIGATRFLSAFMSDLWASVHGRTS